MRVEIDSDGVTFHGVDAYQPPDWFYEAAKEASILLSAEIDHIEGNTDDRKMRVVFADPDFSEEKGEEAEELLQRKYG